MHKNNRFTRIFLKKMVLFHMNNETYVGRGQVQDLVRLQESRATDTKMTSTLVPCIETRGPQALTVT